MYKEFSLFVKEFCDSLPIFKSLLPERKKDKLSFSQEALVSDLLDKEDIKKAHNASNDVYMLQKLLTKVSCSTQTLCKFTKDIDFKEKSIEKKKSIKAVKDTLKELKVGKVILNKLATAGITLEILLNACKVGGFDALHLLLSEHVDGKPRVTSAKATIKKIFDQLKE